jgi:very-short-patch-repair endonuclease
LCAPRMATIANMDVVEGWEAVADEYGLLTTKDARSAGLSTRDLAALVSSDRLVRLDRGWYSLPLTLPPADVDSAWERRRHLHSARTRAALRAREGHTMASHHSALVLNGLPAYAADLRQVHLTRSKDTWSRRRPGLTVHQRVPGAWAVDGVIDTGTAIVQTGTTNGPMAALIAADAALHAKRVSQDQLLEACSRVLGPHTTAVREAVRLADGRTESPGETRLRCALRLMGFAVTPQFRIVDGDFLAIVDFLIEEANLAIEFDGFVKYGRRSPYDLAATPADIVVAEKIREDHVRDLGYGMLRVIWPELDATATLRRRVDAAVHRSRRLAG